MIRLILNIIRKLVNKYAQVSIQFGLFLMASLIVLSTVTAAIPMSKTNFFSEAMTSGKYPDKKDNYQEYEKSYYSHDNQYTPDYNYYYESMKQQQSS